MTFRPALLSSACFAMRRHSRHTRNSC